MRTPTPQDDLYRWHREAMAGKKPVITHEPQCGWFTRRLVKGGPLVPARIWLDQQIDPESGELTAPEVLRCEVAGREADAIDQWTYLAATPLSEARYLYLCADAAWLNAHAPGSPETNPQAPIAPQAIPTLF